MSIINIENENQLLEYIKYNLEEEKKEISKIKNIAIDEIDIKDLRIVIDSNDYIKISDNIDIANFINDLINGRLCIDDSNNNDTKKLNFVYSIKLENLTIKKELKFYAENNKKEFDGSIEFHNVEFEKKVYIYINTFKNGIYFTKCSFYNGIYLNTTKIFNELRIYDSTLYNGINISSCQFDNINIEKCSIKGEFKVENSTIHKISQIININENNIKDKIYDTKIILNNIIFNDNTSLINLDNIKKISEININNTFINGRINLKNIEVKEADFKASVIDGGLINPVNFKVHKFANRETALLLKQQAYARNNAIDALEYKAKEIECHKNDLMKSAKDIIQNKEYSFTKKRKELYKIVGDIASIYLSSLYSDNGQNWLKALGMTIFVTAFCFTVFYIPDLSQSNIIRLYYKNLFPELIKYFIPTDYTLLIKYAASNLNLLLKIFGVLVYFLGKALFWYGSVQTVTAFRKFAKGA